MSLQQTLEDPFSEEIVLEFSRRDYTLLLGCECIFAPAQRDNAGYGGAGFRVRAWVVGARQLFDIRPCDDGLGLVCEPSLLPVARLRRGLPGWARGRGV